MKKRQWKKEERRRETKKRDEEKPWGDAEVANQIDWQKKLDIKEFFEKEEEGDEDERDEE